MILIEFKLYLCDFNGSFGVFVFTDDSGPSLIMDKLIKEMVHNCLEVAEGNKAHVHLILLANDISQFRVSPHQINSDLTVYDYVRSPCDSIGKE